MAVEETPNFLLTNSCLIIRRIIPTMVSGINIICKTIKTTKGSILKYEIYFENALDMENFKHFYNTTIGLNEIQK